MIFSRESKPAIPQCINATIIVCMVILSASFAVKGLSNTWYLNSLLSSEEQKKSSAGGFSMSQMAGLVSASPCRSRELTLS